MYRTANIRFETNILNIHSFSNSFLIYKDFEKLIFGFS